MAKMSMKWLAINAMAAMAGNGAAQQWRGIGAEMKAMASAGVMAAQRHDHGVSA